MKLERSLVTLDKDRKVLRLQQQTENKKERTCNCHKNKDSKLSDVAKHYLYHKPNSLVKWPVQSIKVEEKKSLQRR